MRSATASRKATPSSSITPIMAAARTRRTSRSSRRFMSAASYSASAARSRTKATLAGRCREAARARRERFSTKACTCPPCATKAPTGPTATSSGSSAPTAARRNSCSATSADGSADATKGPANIRPPLVQAACAYALISLIDPNMYVSSGLIRGFSMTARDGSVLNPRFPAPVNTYNPTIHALVDAIFDAMSHVVPSKVRADGSGSRSIILGGRDTYTGKGYVQYEIIAGGAGARAGKDGASGITVNQSNAKIAPVEIIESEFPTRLTRFELIPDSGGPGEFRGGLGIRREYLNLADARFSIRSMKHLIPPNGCAGGGNGRPGDLWINPDTSAAKRLPTRYADYPLRTGDIFRLDTPGGGGHGDALARDAERVLADVREGLVSREAAERDYGVVLERAARSWVINRAATQARRAQLRRDKAKR